MQQRVDFIDMAKGMSIVMVAFAHSPLRHVYPEANDVMRLFRLPLFFFLSGVFLSVTPLWHSYIVKKADALLKPYFVTQFLFLTLAILIGEAVSFRDVAGIIYGNGPTIRDVPMWYLTHLWALFVVACLLAQFTSMEERSPIAQAAIVFALFLFGAISVDWFWERPVFLGQFEAALPGLPFSIDVLPVSLAFFLAGHFMNAQVRAFRPDLALVILAAAATWFVAMNTDAYINLNERLFREPLLATLAAFVGIYLMLALSYWFSKVNLLRRLILPFGVSSLFILIFHGPVANRSLQAMNYFLGVENHEAAIVFTFVLGVIVPIYLRKTVMRSSFLSFFYLPRKSPPTLQSA